MKHLIILAIALSSVSTAFAERSSFRDRSENWLQSNTSETTSGNLRDGSARPTIPGTGEPAPDAPNAPYSPIGDALWLIVAASLVYGAGLYRKKAKVTNQ